MFRYSGPGDVGVQFIAVEHSIREIGPRATVRLGSRQSDAVQRDSQSAKGDDFYLDTVGPRIKRAGIDKSFDDIRKLRRPEPSVVVPAHKRLTDLFREISGLEMSSLASKYLQFHFPRAVYIYDDVPAGRFA